MLNKKIYILLAFIYADVLKSSYQYRAYEFTNKDIPSLPGISLANNNASNIGKIVFKLDSLEAYIDDETSIMDTAAIVKNGRTFVTFRFIGETIGADIKWNPTEKKSLTHLKTRQ